MTRKDSSRAKKRSAAELMRLVAEDRAESAPPQPPVEEERSMTDADAKIQMFSCFVCMPRWAAAARYATARTKADHPDLELNLLRDGSLRDMSPEYLRRIAEALADQDPALSVAWRLLALRHDETRKRIEVVLNVARRLLESVKGDDMSDALERLRIWEDAAAGVYAGDDFFKIAEGEVTHGGSGMAACVELLQQDRWDEAFEWLCRETSDRCGRLGIGHPPRHDDRKKQAALIRGYVNLLFQQQREWCGELALAWQMMLCDPTKPESFNAVLPQVTWLMQHRSVIISITEKAMLRDHMEIWWQAARGEYATSEVSIFRIAERETANKSYEVEDTPMPPEADEESAPTPAPAEPSAPSVIVIRKDRVEERGLPQAWRDLRDIALPLVICEDARMVRERLQFEYPHAWREIAMLTQDLRSGEPARMKPTLLLSQPGTGKSRLVRRLAELISPQMYVSRFDAASSFDGMYSGTPKGWSSAQASVPARAIMMSKTANPICMTDEICKAGESHHNGNLWSAITPHLERETARNYPESGIDAVLDLSHVLHIATANSAEKLPAQLRDRFRVIRIPAPTLAYLPRLASIIVNEMAVEDGMWASHAIEPLAPDELEIIGRAWARERFSMRKLQRLVAATLEARDMCARRH